MAAKRFVSHTETDIDEKKAKVTPKNTLKANNAIAKFVPWLVNKLDDMSTCLQKLLMAGEYKELEDRVLVEGPFIELDKRGDSIRQVTLGITRDNFIIAKRVILNYKDHPWIYYDTESDLDINDLEIEWIVPLCHIKINRVPDEHILSMTPSVGRHRYFQIANTGGTDENKNWARWLERMKYIEDDPYGYIRGLYNNLNVPYELFDVGTGAIDVTSIKYRSELSKKQTRLKPNTLEPPPLKINPSVMSFRQRAKSIVPQAINELLGISPSSVDAPSLERQESVHKEEKTVNEREKNR